jgi:translation initiation factor IF-2
VNLLEKEVGKITHYFSHIGVAVVLLSGSIKAGDTIKIKGHGNEFVQKVASMQIEHKNLKEAKAKQEIGLKVDSPVKEGDIVYPVA